MSSSLCHWPPPLFFSLSAQKINFSSHCPFLFFSCSFFHFLLKSVFLSVPSSLPPRFFRRQSLPCTKWCDGCNWLTSASNRITAGTQIALVITRNPPPFRSGANTVKQKKTDWRERVTVTPPRIDISLRNYKQKPILKWLRFRLSPSRWDEDVKGANDEKVLLCF